MPSALIVGGANCVFDDIKAALVLFLPDAYFVINDMIPKWELRCDYAVTLHPDKMPIWLNWRRNANLPEPGEIWAHRRDNPVIQNVTPDWAGSSGLFAVKVALEQGFDKIVLAGVPMEINQKHFVRGVPWTSANSFRNGWNYRYKEIAKYTRSMSGWTKGLLGAPTHEWLNDQSVSQDPEWVST